MLAHCLIVEQFPVPPSSIVVRRSEDGQCDHMEVRVIAIIHSGFGRLQRKLRETNAASAESQQDDDDWR